MTLKSIPNPERDDLAASVAEMRRKLPALVEHQRVMAKLQRERYLALIEEGFTPKQALELAAKVS